MVWTSEYSLLPFKYKRFSCLSQEHLRGIWTLLTEATFDTVIHYTIFISFILLSIKLSLSLYFSLSYFLLFACLHPLKINFQYLCFLLGLEHQSLTLVGNAQLLYPPGRPQQNTLATRQATIETSLSPGVQTRTYMLRFSLYRQINLGELRWVGTRRWCQLTKSRLVGSVGSAQSSYWLNAWKSYHHIKFILLDLYYT